LTFEYEMADFIDFRDREACREVREITREEITEHENDDFEIRVIDDPSDFYQEMGVDMVRRIKDARDRGDSLVGIFPVGPMPQYGVAARLINQLQIPCDHVHIFAMDEYANEDGRTAPKDWFGSFQKAFYSQFIQNIESDYRVTSDQIHFPTTDKIDSYSKRIQDLGGADVCYGGIGWCGHIAFWESHIGKEFGDDLEAYKQAGPRTVTLHPMTIMQNALHSFNGDWSAVPPKANTIGPEQIMGADDRSFWLDGHFIGNMSWQKFIARLVAHGPIDTRIPGSILQTAPGSYTLLGGVAENINVDMS